MKIIFIPPFPESTPYIWVLSRFFMASENFDDIGIICPKSYVSQDMKIKESRWENDFFSKIRNSYELFPIDWIDTKNIYLLDNLYPVNEAEKAEDIKYKIATERIPKLEAQLNKIIETIGVREIDYFVSWFNCPSLSTIARKFNKKVIFNELGPLRFPAYKSTVYFDFGGINGANSISSEYNLFKEEFLRKRFKLFSRIEISEFYKPFLDLSPKQYIAGKFKVGVALQCESDSNLFAYSNGWTNLKLLKEFQRLYGNNNVLVRFHPLGEKYEQPSPVDQSSFVIEFLNKIEELITINSSVAAEAILFGKKVQILGSNPLNFIVDEKSSEEKLLKINFFFLFYLLPAPLLFTDAYYKWRLSNPSFEEIGLINLFFLTGDLKYLDKVSHRENSFKFKMLQLFNQFKKDSVISSAVLLLEDFLNSKKNNDELNDIKSENTQLEVCCDRILNAFCTNENLYSKTVSEYSDFLNSKGIKEFLLLKRILKKLKF